MKKTVLAKAAVLLICAALLWDILDKNHVMSSHTLPQLAQQVCVANARTCLGLCRLRTFHTPQRLERRCSHLPTPHRIVTAAAFSLFPAAEQ